MTGAGDERGTRTWLDDMTILRETDRMICHHWLNGGERCDKEMIEVPPSHAGSHRTLADYLRAAEHHFEQVHGIAVSR